MATSQSPNEYSSPGDGAFVANGANGNHALGEEEKPRLTEEEKKKNHIASGTSPVISVTR
jgi:hypothetical protein